MAVFVANCAHAALPGRPQHVSMVDSHPLRFGALAYAVHLVRNTSLWR